MLLSQAAWVAIAKAGGDFTGSGADQQQGGLPAAVRRTLVMGVAAFLVLFLVGAFFYGGGVAGAVGEQLGVA